MKISAKLIIGFLSIALLVGFVGVFAIASNRIIQRDSRVVLEIREMTETLEDLLRDSMVLINTQTIDDYQEIKIRIENSRKDFDILHAKSEEIIHRLGAESFNNGIDDFTIISNGIIAIHQQELIRNREFDEKAILERDLRRTIRIPLFALNNAAVTKDLGNMQYKSKEALYQYKDQEHIDEWLETIEKVKERTFSRNILQDIDVYHLLAQDMGVIVIEQKEIEAIQSTRIEQLRDITSTLEEEEEKFITRLREESESTARTTRVTLLSVIVIAFATAIGLGLYIARSIAQSVTKTRDVAIEIASGNMTVEIDTSGNDEIAELNRAIDIMRESLKVAGYKKKEK